MISHRPYWLDTVSETDFVPPGGRIRGELREQARVVIVGGGIVGLACAYYLGLADLEGVLLLERGDLLSEASGANGGGLWPGQQAPGSGTFYELGRISQQLIAGLAEAEALEYRRNGVMVLARSSAEAEHLRADTERRRSEGLGIEWLSPEETCRLEPELAPEQVYGAARYEADGHINPARLGAAFARWAQEHDVRIRAGVTVHGIEEVDHVTRVFTDQGTVTCSHLVVTPGAWAHDWEQFLRLSIPIEPAKGQLVATAPQPPRVRHAIMSRFGLLQTAGGNIISGGTVEFTGFEGEPSDTTCNEIWEDTQALVPTLRGVPLTHSWVRFRPHTPDGLPLVGFCGPHDRHVIAAGHFRNGLLLSAVTGKIVADLLTRGHTLYPIGPLDPHRFGTRKND